MKILVTGGTGFLGKHLQQEFKKHPEHEVIFVSRSSCDCKKYDSVVSYFEKQSTPFDVIVHGAATCGGILANQKSPATFLTDNLHMGLNMYEAARIYGVKKVYSLGSVCAYPIHCPAPFKESDLWNGRPEPTNEPYGHAKRTLLMLGLTYRQQFGIGGAHLIPVNMYGEWDHFDLVNSHVIPALINKFVTAKRTSQTEVHCWGTGAATREFLYAGDAAEAIVKAVISEFDCNDPINLGTGVDISIKELAFLIGNLVGFEGEIVFTNEVSDGQPKRQLDISQAHSLLNFEAKTKLIDGLIKTIDWYRKFYGYD